VSLIAGDCNDLVEEICLLIPPDNLVLSFVDPFDIGLRFDTIKRVSQAGYGVDFLLLLAFQMDAARGDNPKHYANPNNTKIDRMLGDADWRLRWEKEQNAGNTDFSKFLALEFSRSMETIGYLRTELHQMRKIRTLDKHVPLYYLALFSRNKTAFKYWNEVLKYSTPQRGLFD
jgi:three-Cys-motif partner protein